MDFLLFQFKEAKMAKIEICNSIMLILFSNLNEHVTINCILFETQV